MLVLKPDSPLAEKYRRLYEKRQLEVESINTILSHFLQNRNEADSVFMELDVKSETRSDYSYRVRHFFDFCENETLDLNIFLRYKEAVSGLDWSVSSKSKYIAGTRVFLKELARHGFIPDITINIRGFGQGKLHKRDGVSAEEVSKMSAFLLNAPNTPQIARLNAVFHLLALEGFRQVEIARLSKKDILFSRGIAMVLGKGHDDRQPVKLHKKTLSAIENHIAINKVSDGPLFLSLGNKNKDGRLTTRHIRRIVKQLLGFLGVDNSTHGFRHFFATETLKVLPAHRAQKFTRHKSIDMLQVYNDEIQRDEDVELLHKKLEQVAYAS